MKNQSCDKKKEVGKTESGGSQGNAGVQNHVQTETATAIESLYSNRNTHIHTQGKEKK